MLTNYINYGEWAYLGIVPVAVFGGIIAALSYSNTYGGRADKKTIHLEFTNETIKVILKNIKCTKKEDIKVTAYDNSVDIIVNVGDRKYRSQIPLEANIDKGRWTYDNERLEIIFPEETIPKGKPINIPNGEPSC